MSRILKKIQSIAYKTNDSIWFVREGNEKIERLTGPRDYEVCFDGFEEIVEWLKKNNAIYPWMYSEKEISTARRHGHIIPFLRVKNDIVCYTKVALNKVYIRDYDTVFPLAPNKAMFYDTTVLAQFRGKRLPQCLKNEIFIFLKKRGIDQIFAHIEPWNVASIKSNERMGFKEIGSNRFVRIFALKFHSNNPKMLLS
jgi:RimJ/RimL family protein N-acetyltransferase